MGSIQASAIIGRAAALLNDAGHDRWSEAELLEWLSDGQRHIVLVRPDANSTIDNVTLAADAARQEVPADALRLLAVFRNMGTSGSAPGRIVTWASWGTLNALDPDWQSSTAAGAVECYLTDERFPRDFWVYPRPDEALVLEAGWSVAPAEITATATAIGIPDIYAPGLLDYMLYRAFCKDDAAVQNLQRSTQHMRALAEMLGVKSQVDMAATARANTPPANEFPGAPRQQ